MKPNFSRKTDVKVQDKCDETMEKMAKLIGWEEDFSNIAQKSLKL